MVSHGSLTHLLFNMIGFYTIGRAIELRYNWMILGFLFFVISIVGSILFIIVYQSAIILNIPSVNNINGLIGASGGVIGLFGFYMVNQYKYNREDNKILFFIIPMRIQYAVLLFATISLGLFIYGGFGYLGTSHIGHLTGLLTGVIIGYYSTYIKGIRYLIGNGEPVAIESDNTINIYCNKKVDLEYDDYNFTESSTYYTDRLSIDIYTYVVKIDKEICDIEGSVDDSIRVSLNDDTEEIQINKYKHFYPILVI